MIIIAYTTDVLFVCFFKRPNYILQPTFFRSLILCCCCCSSSIYTYISSLVRSCKWSLTFRNWLCEQQPHNAKDETEEANMNALKINQKRSSRSMKWASMKREKEKPSKCVAVANIYDFNDIVDLSIASCAHSWYMWLPVCVFIIASRFFWETGLWNTNR